MLSSRCRKATNKWRKGYINLSVAPGPERGFFHQFHRHKSLARVTTLTCSYKSNQYKCFLNTSITVIELNKKNKHSSVYKGKQTVCIQSCYTILQTSNLAMPQEQDVHHRDLQDCSLFSSLRFQVWCCSTPSVNVHNGPWFSTAEYSVSDTCEASISLARPVLVEYLKMKAFIRS